MPWRAFEGGLGPVSLIYQAIKLDLPDAPDNIALFSSFAMVGVVMDAQAINLPAGSKPTIYTLIVGPAGSGKTFVATHAAEKLNSLGVPIKVTGKPSREGLARELSEHLSVVNIADEVHEYLKSKKNGSYLSDVVELWKQVFDRRRIVFSRRKKEASFEIPPHANLVVLATTTPEDFDEVAELITDASMRRMIVLRTNRRINMFKPSKNPIQSRMLWRAVAAQLLFISKLKWVLYMCSDEKLLDVAESLVEIVFGEVRDCEVSFLQQYSIRLGMILAVNDLVEEIAVETSARTGEDMMRSDPEVFKALMYETAIVRERREGEPRDEDLEKGCCYDHKDLVLSFVSEVQRAVLDGEFDRESIGRAVARIIKARGSKPRIVWITKNDEIYVVVPPSYLVKGMALAFYSLLDGMEFRTAQQIDPLVRKIVRIACRYRNDGKNTVTIRSIARGLGKRYVDIYNALKTAILAGFLTIDSCSEDVTQDSIVKLDDIALRKCRFRVDPSLC